jgi:N-acetylneuraminic acid mutarotase
MYVFAGVGPDKKANNSLTCFNLDTKEWQTIQTNGEAPRPRYGHICALHNDKMYIHGGNEYIITPIDDFFSYDFATNTWNKLNTQGGPSARYNHSAALHNGKLFIFGGSENKKVFFNDLHYFDIATNTWHKVELSNSASPLPKPRSGHITFLIGGRLYLYGGFGDEGGYTHLEDMYYLDLEKLDCWVPVELHEGSTMPKSGRCLSCVTISDKCYVFGGYDGKVPQRILHCYEPDIKLWNVIKLALGVGAEDNFSGMSAPSWYDPTPRYGHSTILDNENRIFIYAGTGSMFLGDVMAIDTTAQ